MENDKRPGVVIDSREQIPWAFRGWRVAAVRALNAGDYSPEGFEGEIAVERKSVEDLVRTITADIQRWRREVGRLLDHKASCVIVEGTLQDAISPSRWCAAPRVQLLRAIAETVAEGLPITFAGDRLMAIASAEAFLSAAVARVSAMNANAKA